MPRPKKAAAKDDDGPAKKKAVAKNKDGYVMPEKIHKGTILQDVFKREWRVGDSIGIGGFGEIYTACKEGTTNYDYVIKCEPHANGPLFVEMHFYLRHGKLSELEKFKKEHKLKFLGLPYMFAHGSFEANKIKHRFIVIPKYGQDLSKFVKESKDGCLSAVNVYRLAIYMITVYQYLHSTGYSHGDLKAANILMGIGKDDLNFPYLVDFGLATSITTGPYKPDPKKMHNGTLEYTSIDAHHGVVTRRSDFQILAYNMIQWLGGVLPWAKVKTPVAVQKAKESFMEDLSTSLSALFPKGVPEPLDKFMHYIKNLEYDEVPDYDASRKIFEDALKKMKVPVFGPLGFNGESPAPAKIKKAPKPAAATPPVKMNKSKENSIILDSDEEDSAFEKANDNNKAATPRNLKTVAAKNPVPVRTKAKNSPLTRSSALAENLNDSSLNSVSGVASTPRRASKRFNESSFLSESEPSPKLKRTAATVGSSDSAKKQPPATPKAKVRTAPLKTHINFSPSISIQPQASMEFTKPGHTIVNDNMTPNPKAKKVYELSVDLDISMDANVIINVNRKNRRAKAASSKSEANESSPSPSIRFKKVSLEESAQSRSSSKSRTPTVRLHRTKRQENTP